MPGVYVQAAEGREPKLTGSIYRYKWTLTGGQIGTGFLSLYALQDSASQAFATATATLINGAWGSGASGGVPSGITLSPDGAVDQVDVVTGQLQSAIPVTPPSAITGGNSAVYAAPSGFNITWLTPGVVNGKRLRGRTFFVPISSAKYDANGTLLDSYAVSIRAAAATYIGGAYSPCVWHRPVNGAGGSAYAMTGYSVADRVAQLTSRR